MRWQIIEGDCLAVIREMPDASVDAVVTDPPYGLSEHKTSEVAACLAAWLAGEPYAPKARGGFMGRSWDAWVPGPEVWREVLRVLKPGGHALVFAGSRTADLMGMALRLAGFEMRDTLQWLYGTGFPKSLDVSKAIDAAGGVNPEATAGILRRRRESAGMTREALAGVVGCTVASIRDWEEGRSRSVGAAREFMVPSVEYRAALANVLGYTADERRVTGCAQDRRADGTVIGLGHSGIERTGGHTPEAAAWAGWGTALKPAYEPVLLCRQPLAGTVAANVLSHGTGALNVDGCRVGPGHEGGTGRDGEASAARRYADRGGTDFAATPGPRGGDPAGRWPANVVLDESAAAMLDEASGERRPGERPARQLSSIGYHGGTEPRECGARVVLDGGGASRFFYTAKADSSERHAGTADGNRHPTVKPLDLMRWLVRLVTPPDGLVLDPFAGSGSTGCAAMREGRRFLGIEREAEYAEVARQRIAYWAADGHQPDLFGAA